MAPRDLTAARARTEGSLLDTVEITRNPDAKRDGVIDPETLKLVEPSGQPVVVYDAETLGEGDRVLGGIARLRPAGLTARSTSGTEGGRQYTEREYFLSLPYDAPKVIKGDVARCVTSHNDEQLVDKTFIVRETPTHTFLITRQILVELRA